MFVASSGGHLSEISALKSLADRYETILVTEKTPFTMNPFCKNVCYVPQINRKEALFLPKLLWIAIKELGIFLKHRPDALISTGALCCVPAIFIASKTKTKVIYIESMARINELSATGEFSLKRADRFYAQWECMTELDPSIIYRGRLL